MMRYVDYKAVQDPEAEKTWKAVCVSGDEKDCGATSMEYAGDEAATDWMAEHCKETGHQRFQRLYEDYVLVRKAGE